MYCPVEFCNIQGFNYLRTQVSVKEGVATGCFMNTRKGFRREIDSDLCPRHFSKQVGLATL
ncbi:hypothetical protein MICRO11B_290066 [Micrococcus luteus]|nr:hypothetical protein MICRO11B_290066 [Micrococcus luteus]